MCKPGKPCKCTNCTCGNKIVNWGRQSTTTKTVWPPEETFEPSKKPKIKKEWGR
jgi:hypothetical protein